MCHPMKHGVKEKIHDEQCRKVAAEKEEAFAKTTDLFKQSPACDDEVSIHKNQCDIV